MIMTITIVVVVVAGIALFTKLDDRRIENAEVERQGGQDNQGTSARTLLRYILPHNPRNAGKDLLH